MAIILKPWFLPRYSLFLGLVAVGSFIAALGSDLNCRGRQFIGFDSFNRFEKGIDSGKQVLTSPVISAKIHFNELIVSWNATLSSNEYLVVEARAFYPDHPTKYYHLGLWSQDPIRFPPRSQAAQRDAQGDVSTDTLILNQSSDRLQIRITIASDGQSSPLKFLGLSLADTMAAPAGLPPNRKAWGKQIAVPERSQM